MVIPDEKLIELYRRMLIVRANEQKHAELLSQGRIELMSHFGTGQEAVAIGVTGPLQRKDWLFGTHRGVGEFIGKGMTPKDIWCEYMGKKTGPAKGKGGLHLSDRNLGIPGIVSSLGTDFPIAVGTALGAKMRGADDVTLYYVGEGTCNEGDAHPSMVMASLWKVPIVFAIVTNQFCEMAYMCTHYPTEDVAPRAAGYGIPYEIVDGQDIEVVYEATEKAVNHARSGKGPYVVEYKTFRMALHFSGDPGGYVKQEDLDTWAKRDPIDLCQKKLFERNILSAEEDRKIRSQIQAEVDSAVANAFKAPDPTAEDFIADVYEQKGVL